MHSNRGIFALDPGGHSGIAMGIFDVSPLAPVEEIMQKGINMNSATVEGDEYEQIKLISTYWSTFYADCVHSGCMDPELIEFVCEDFVQRPGGSGGKEGQSPIRVMWGVEGYRLGRADEWRGRKKSKVKVYAPRMILQTPGDAAAFGAGDRLRDWGCWVRGREHERSAWRHVGLRVGRIQNILKASPNLPV
jgi:hypothetical protein